MGNKLSGHSRRKHSPHAAGYDSSTAAGCVSSPQPSTKGSIGGGSSSNHNHHHRRHLHSSVTNAVRQRFSGSKRAGAAPTAASTAAASTAASTSGRSPRHQIVSCPDLSRSTVAATSSANPSFQLGTSTDASLCAASTVDVGTSSHHLADTSIQTLDVRVYRSYAGSLSPSAAGLSSLGGGGGVVGNGSLSQQHNHLTAPTSTVIVSDSVPDIKIYRRSAALYNDDEDDSPEAFNNRSFPSRSRSAVDSMVNGGRGPANGGATVATTYLPRLQRGDVTASTAADGGSSRARTSRGMKKSSSADSRPNGARKVTLSDFPDTETVRRRLNLFESFYVESLLRRYESMTDSMSRLSVVSVAIHLQSRPRRTVSLHQYMTGGKTGIPLQLLDPHGDNTGEYIVTVPDALFHLIMCVRMEKTPSFGGAKNLPQQSHSIPSSPVHSDAEELAIWCRLGRDIVESAGIEASRELSRMFEYQIALLTEERSIQMLADHAVECAGAYIEHQKGVWDRNSLVRGTVFGAVFGHTEMLSGAWSVQAADVGLAEELLEQRRRQRKVSVIIGQRELKWDIGDILKRPGLRRDRLLFAADLTVTDAVPPAIPSSTSTTFHQHVGAGAADLLPSIVESPSRSDASPDPCPWTFHVSAACDVLHYGYRGTLLDWDYFASAYSTVADDEGWFDEPARRHPDDFHRLYRPHRVLVGTELMQSYCSGGGSSSSSTNTYGRHPHHSHSDRQSGTTLAEFTRSRLNGDRFCRDVISPVYRPLKALSLGRLRRADFAGVDLTRISLSGADLRRTGLRSCRLSFGRLSGAKFGRVESCEGADLSYSTLNDAELPPDFLKHPTIVARFAVVGSSHSHLQQLQQQAVGEAFDSPEGAVEVLSVDERDELDGCGAILVHGVDAAAAAAITVSQIVTDLRQKVATERQQKAVSSDVSPSHKHRQQQQHQTSLVQNALPGPAPPSTEHKLGASTGNKKRTKKRRNISSGRAEENSCNGGGKTAAGKGLTKTVSPEHLGSKNNNNDESTDSETAAVDRSAEKRAKKKQKKKKKILEIGSGKKLFAFRTTADRNKENITPTNAAGAETGDGNPAVKENPHVDEVDVAGEFIPRQENGICEVFVAAPEIEFVDHEPITAISIGRSLELKAASSVERVSGPSSSLRELSGSDQRERPEVESLSVDDEEPEAEIVHRSPSLSPQIDDSEDEQERVREVEEEEVEGGSEIREVDDSASEASLVNRKQSPSTIYNKPEAGYLSELHSSLPLLLGFLSNEDRTDQHSAIDVPTVGGNQQDSASSRQKYRLIPKKSVSLQARQLLTVDYNNCRTSERGGRQDTGSYRPPNKKGRRVLSRLDIEYINRSQIFKMITELNIPPLECILPEAQSLLVERRSEMDHVIDLVSISGRVVTIVGFYGVGKSALAVGTAHALKSKSIVSVRVDALGCGTSDSFFRRVTRAFGLHFRPDERKYLYNWINAHDQRLLFLFDDLDDLPEPEMVAMSEFIDELTASVKNVRVLCTARKPLPSGNGNRTVYSLDGDFSLGAEKLVRRLLPDLHDEGVESLAAACDHNPFAIRFVCAALTASVMEGLDTGRLFEELTGSRVNPLTAQVAARLEKLTHDVVELGRLRRVADCFLKTTDAIDSSCRQFLAHASCFTSGFDLVAAQADDSTKPMLDRLVKVGLLRTISPAADGTSRYRLPSVVKLIASTLLSADPDCDRILTRCQTTMLDRLLTATRRYHDTVDGCYYAIGAVDADYDNIIAAVRSSIPLVRLHHELSALASLEGVMFVAAILPDTLCSAIYESIERQATVDGRDAVRARATSCLSFVHHVADRSREAIRTAELAVELAAQLDDVETSTTGLYCLSKAQWSAHEKRKALATAKQAFEACKTAAAATETPTVLSAVSAVYVAEWYAWMLTQSDNFQSARHCYNLSDPAVRGCLAGHPMTIDGLDSRRAIWDGLLLLERATAAARGAADTCRRYHGDHPRTARMLARLGDAVVKRGSLNEAIEAVVDAASMRVKVLGQGHLDTASSYRTLATLMLRAGQYDQAVRFGRAALDSCACAERQSSTAGAYDDDEVRPLEDQRQAIVTDAKDTVSQARYRMECKSAVFVQLETRRDPAEDKLFQVVTRKL